MRHTARRKDGVAYTRLRPLVAQQNFKLARLDDEGFILALMDMRRRATLWIDLDSE
jgi:hypothetical protein